MKKLLTLTLALCAVIANAQTEATPAKIKLETLSGEGFNYTLTTTNGEEQEDYTKDFFKEYNGRYSMAKTGEFTITELKMLAVSPNTVKAVGKCNEVEEGTYNCGIVFIEGIKNITPADEGFQAAKNIMDVFIKETNSAALKERMEEAEDALKDKQKTLDKTTKEIEKLEDHIKDLEKEMSDTQKSLEENKKLKVDQEKALNEQSAKVKSLKAKQKP